MSKILQAYIATKILDTNGQADNVERKEKAGIATAMFMMKL